MSTTIAAPYVQTHTELRDVVSKAKKLPDDQVKQGLGILSSQLTNPDAQKIIGAEVGDLSIRAVTLGKTFAAVDGLVIQQDGEKATIEALTKTFQALHQVNTIRWTDIGLI